MRRNRCLACLGISVRHPSESARWSHDHPRFGSIAIRRLPDPLPVVQRRAPPRADPDACAGRCPSRPGRGDDRPAGAYPPTGMGQTPRALRIWEAHAAGTPANGLDQSTRRGDLSEEGQQFVISDVPLSLLDAAPLTGAVTVTECHLPLLPFDLLCPIVYIHHDRSCSLPDGKRQRPVRRMALETERQRRCPSAATHRSNAPGELRRPQATGKQYSGVADRLRARVPSVLRSGWPRYRRSAHGRHEKETEPRY